jgi:hypothetical protein
VAPPSGPVLETTFVSHFGANQFTPSVSSLSAYNYAPIPISVALQQYLPAAGFNSRQYTFNHRGKHLRHSDAFATITPTQLFDRRPVMTIPQRALDRSRFHPEKSVSWTHTKHSHPLIYAVVPTQATTQSVVDTPGVFSGRPPSTSGTHEGNDNKATGSLEANPT